ncbi:MAG: hypothetical protein ACKO41_03735 [Sphingomonadales bacterium]
MSSKSDYVGVGYLLILLKVLLTVCSVVVSNVAFGVLPGGVRPIGIRLDTIRKKADSFQERPELFSAGFIDVVNSGQVGASARLVKLQIGEQGKFSLPLSVYGGVSNNSFSGISSLSLLRGNEQLVGQFITPLSGLLNLSVEGTWFMRPRSFITKWGLLYQFGERVLTGNKLTSAALYSSQRPLHFLNSYLVSGLYFQTGAWEKFDQRNMGVCWLAIRYHLCYSGNKQLRQFLPAFTGNGLYSGYSMGMGVRINSLINLRAVYYQYQKAPEPDYLLPIYQFSFNYTVNGGRS